MQKHVNFIWLSWITYIVSKFFRLNFLLFGNFVCNKNNFGVVHPHKHFSTKLRIAHVVSLIIWKLFKFVSLWKIPLLYVKQWNGYLVPQFSGVILTPENPIWAPKKKRVSLSLSTTKAYIRTKEIGEGHLPNVPCRSKSIIHCSICLWVLLVLSFWIINSCTTETKNVQIIVQLSYSLNSKSVRRGSLNLMIKKFHWLLVKKKQWV